MREIFLRILKFHLAFIFTIARFEISRLDWSFRLLFVNQIPYKTGDYGLAITLPNH